jgi:16S rRNA G966 N2-methylase RsmD
MAQSATPFPNSSGRVTRVDQPPLTAATIVVVCSGAMDWKNKLYFGDNVEILRREVPDASVGLIYLDPPFDSNATYSISVAPLHARRQRSLCGDP